MRGLFFAIIGCLAWSCIATAQDLNAERVDLARHIVDIQYKNLTSKDSRTDIIKYLTVSNSMSLAFSCGMTCGPFLNSSVLSNSLGQGVSKAQDLSRTNLVDFYAKSLTLDDLKSTLAYLKSADGRASIKARKYFLTKIQSSILNAEQNSVPSYQPSESESKFNATSAGRNLVALSDHPEIRYAAIDMLQSAIAETETLYCIRAKCSADEHQQFKYMRILIGSERAHGEHAMNGDTAGELFTNPSDANLARFACSGNKDGILESIKSGASVNVIGKEGIGPGASKLSVTPLIWAVTCKNADGVKGLLDVGADPNQAEPGGETPVLLAAEMKDSAILKILVNHGGDPNAHDDRETALDRALSVATSFNSDGERPVVRLFENWNILLAAGADPFLVPSNGRPIIESLVYSDDLDKVEWLLDRGWAGDPVALGRTLETQEEADGNSSGLSSKLRADREHLKDRLKTMGVRFPIGPLVNLSQDAKGFYIQPHRN